MDPGQNCLAQFDLDLPRGLVRIHHHPALRLLPGHFKITLAHALVEGQLISVHPVPFTAASAPPPQSLLHIQIKQNKSEAKRS